MSRVKLAITGGPSGGKTTLIETLKKEKGSKVAIVPEAASILYRGGFPRRKIPESRTYAQKAIYFTQKELEAMLAVESPETLLVCDRGSLDGIAYWPFSQESFLQAINSNLKTEIQRYDYVLHLDTASSDSYDQTNPLRTETYAEAVELNQKIHQAWASHPQRFVISNHTDFISKITFCISIIDSLLKGMSYVEILRQFPQIQSR